MLIQFFSPLSTFNSDFFHVNKRYKGVIKDIRKDGKMFNESQLSYLKTYHTFPVLYSRNMRFGVLTS